LGHEETQTPRCEKKGLQKNLLDREKGKKKLTGESHRHSPRQPKAQSNSNGDRGKGGSGKKGERGDYFGRVRIIPRKK